MYFGSVFDIKIYLNSHFINQKNWETCSGLGLRTVPYYGYGRTFYGRIFINFPVTRTVKSF